MNKIEEKYKNTTNLVFETRDVNTLQQLKTESDELFGKYLKACKRKALINNINEGKLSFIKVNKIMNGLGGYLLIEEKGVNLLKDYIKTVKNDPILSDIYALRERVKDNINITNKVDFIKESVGLLKPVSEKEMATHLKKLSPVLSEAIGMIKFNIVEDVMNDTTHNKLDESIDFLVTKPKTIKTVSLHEAKIKDISDYMSEVEGLSSYCDSINEDKERVKLSEGDVESIFKKEKINCISVIENTIKVCDDETVIGKLNQLKENVDKIKFDGNANNNIIKLMSIKSNLENN